MTKSQHPRSIALRAGLAPVAGLAVFAVFAACAALTACAAGSRHTTYLGHVPIEGFDARAERSWTVPLELEGAEALEIEAGGADVSLVATGAEDAARLEARAEIVARDQAEAEAVLAQVEVRTERTNGRLRVTLHTPALEAQGGRHTVHVLPSVDLEIHVPAALAVEARATSGDLAARGLLGGCRLTTDFGDVTLERLGGDVVVETSSGDVRALDLACHDASLRSDFGDVEIEHGAAERLRAACSSGTVTARRVHAPDVTLESAFGAVRALDVAADRLQARASSGDVTVEGTATGEVIAHSDFGDVSLTGHFARLEATTSSGDVRVVALGDVPPAGPWTLGSDYGDAHLVVNEAFGCELDARTAFGSIEAAVDLEDRSSSDRGRSLRARLGPGGPRVTITVESGDVHVRRR